MTRALDVEVDRVRYSFLVRGLRITVGSYEERPDYSAEVAATFDRFRQTDRVDESAELRDWETYLPLGVLDLVARNHPDLFGRLDAFRERHRDYLDPTVELLDRELQFYLGYLVLVAEDRSLGREAIDKRDCFGDLHLDQIVAAAIANREEYQLDPFFQYDPAHGFYVADSPRSLFLRAGRDDEGERSYKITPGGTVADQLRRGLLPCRVRFRSRRVRLSEAHDAHVRPAEARVHTRLSSRRAVGREQIVTNRFPAQGGLPFRSCGAPAGGRRDGRLR